MITQTHPERRERTATIAVLALAVLLAVLAVAGPVAAASDAATYKLVDIKRYYVPGENPVADESIRIDNTQYDTRGGFIEFTQRSIATSGDCVGKVQHFKFSWVFNKDVSTFSGREGDPLVVMNTKWEGDSGVPGCIDENPFVYIRSGGIWGTGPNDAAADYLFNLNFANPSGENRVYFKPTEGTGFSTSPTISFGKFIKETGAISIQPAPRFPYSNTRGPSLSVVYVYERVPDAPTVTATTAPQMTVATTTAPPRGTTVSGTVATPATTTASRTTTAPTGTGGGSGGCGWSGTWDTEWGTMVLSQSGTLVTGTYTFEDGVIEGTVSGNTLTGRWSQATTYKEPNDAGQFVLTMAPDCRSFTGTWGYGGESTGGSWSGTRSGTGGTVATTATTRTTPPTTTTAAQTTTERTTAPTTAATTAATTTAAGTAVTTGGGSTTVRNGCPASGTLLYVGQWRPSTGQTIEIPIMICNAVDLANMDLTATYDPSVLTFVEARKGGLLGPGFLFESNDQGGRIRISFASQTGVTGSGSIAILVFRVAGQTGSSTTIGGTITNAGTSSGGRVTIPVETGGVTVSIPNPRNPEGGQCGPTSLTALKALQMAVGKIPVDMAYDVTRDGTVNSADARELLRLATEEVCVL